MRILVALATTRTSAALGPKAVAEARLAGLPVTLLLVTEEAEIDRVRQLRTDPRLLGTDTLEQLLAHIEREHRTMLAEQADEIDALARAAGVEVARETVSGSYEQVVAERARAGPWKVIYWLRPARGFVASFFLGSDEDEVVRVERR